MSRLIRLGDHTKKIGSGQTPRGGHHSYASKGIPLIRSQNVLMGAFNYEGLALISDAIDNEMEGSRVQQGDVLLNITGASIGRVCVVPDEVCPANVNQHVCIIRCTESLLPDYLAALLASRELQDKIWESQAGGTRQALTKQIVEDFVIPWRPINEQRRITNRLKSELTEVEIAHQATRSQWIEARSLKGKALEAAFANLANWQPIGSVAKLQSGYAFKSEAFKPSGVRLLRNTNILPGKVYWDETVYLSEADAQRFPTYDLAAGDVLVSLDRPVISSGVKVARVIQSDLPALLLQRVGRFLLDPCRLDPSYLFAFVQTDHFIAEISGHEQSLGVPHISPSQVDAIEIPLPDLGVQKQIAQRLTEFTESWAIAVDALQRQLDDLGALQKRLLAQAFET